MNHKRTFIRRRFKLQHSLFWTLWASLLVLILGGMMLTGLKSWCEPQIINHPPTAPTGSNRYVTDMAGLLSRDDQAKLTEVLRQADEEKLGQIAILVIPQTERALPELGAETMNAWGVGHKETNDGILILVDATKVKQNASKGRVFIGTGYGVQDVLPDAVLGRILRGNTAPLLAKKQYGQALIETVNALVMVLMEKHHKAEKPSLEEQAAAVTEKSSKDSDVEGMVIIGVVLAFAMFIGFIILLLTFISKRNKSREGSSSSYNQGDSSSSDWSSSSDSWDSSSDSSSSFDGGSSDGGGSEI